MKKLLVLFFYFTIVSCSSTALYNPSYVTSTSFPQTQLDGKALIFTDSTADQMILSQSPSSFTGGATTLNIEIGNMIRQIAKTKFSQIFEQGADLSNSEISFEEYIVVITPELQNLDYQFSQLENLGFAITPKAQIRISVVAKDPSGTTVIDNSYDSGLIQGDTYAFSSDPSDKANRAIHEALSFAMGNAVKDVYEALEPDS